MNPFCPRDKEKFKEYTERVFVSCEKNSIVEKSDVRRGSGVSQGAEERVFFYRQRSNFFVVDD